MRRSSRASSEEAPGVRSRDELEGTTRTGYLRVDEKKSLRRQTRLLSENREKQDGRQEGDGGGVVMVPPVCC